MDNPILDVIRQYDSIRLSAVIVTLPMQGGWIKIDIRRQGGSNATVPVDADLAMRGVTCSVWIVNSPVIRTIEGEYYADEVATWVKAVAEHTESLDVLRVNDGPETRWHFRPGRNWRVLKIGKRYCRVLPDGAR